METRKRFIQNISYLNNEMVEMGMMIESNIQRALEALIKNDSEAAKKVISDDLEVNSKQRKIEDICFDLLIKQQPVASDLRMITAAMKIVTDMERIGDHAADISEISLLLDKGISENSMSVINKMAMEAMEMLVESIDSFIYRDIEKARKVVEHDDVVDELFIEVKKQIAELIREGSNDGEVDIDLLMIAKYLERIGDHATNIAEWVIFFLDKKANADV